MQDYIWFFDGVQGRTGIPATGGQPGTPGGNLRPIRGRINLNTASEDTLTRLISGESVNPTPNDVPAPYTLVASLGSGAAQSALNAPQNPVSVTIPRDVAKQLADDIIAIRPLRNMSDLIWGGPQEKGLYSTIGNQGKSLSGIFNKLQNDPSPITKGGCLDPSGTYYYGFVTDAILSRLAQFGTVRQQRYTVDIVARSTKTTPSGATATAGEVRMLAHVYLDTFSRHAFVESLEYR